MANTIWQDDGDKQRVRDASDIVRIIGEVVALKPKGREYGGLCPFHDDHNPSMAVVPHKQIFHCFVCGTGGDVFTFVRKFHKMEFREALEYLAQRAGIELKPRRRETNEGGQEGISRQQIFEANAVATEFFKAIYNHPEHGRAARAVVEKRGISSEMVEKFGIGASPDRFDGLLLTIRNKQLDPRAFAEAGLLRTKIETGHMYDTFRDRLMFPITDVIGRPIAFGGRKIKEEDEPKYLNSPESRVFNKSATLFGLAQASRAIQVQRTAVITEGYTDTIACYQAGLENVIATLGTALTREHAVILRRLCDRVVLLFDGDEAGQRAADRAAEIFFSEPLDVVVATLEKVTDAKDPDELLKREGGLDLLRRAIGAGVDVLRYRFARVARTVAGGGIAVRSRAVEEEVARLAELGLSEVEPVRRRMIIRELARLADIGEETIARAIPVARGARKRPEQAIQSPAPAAESAGTPSALARLATGSLRTIEALVGCALCDPSLLGTLDRESGELLSPERFETAELRELAGVLLSMPEGGPRDLNTLLPLLTTTDSQSAATILQARTDRETGSDADRLKRHWSECLRLAHIESKRSAPAMPTGDTETLIARIAQAADRSQRHGANLKIYPKAGGR
ncbi:MAG: DNA primase [Phycisphaeraceae bacterium]|nr:DNA primase [Phycisphaeraceae bacterium]